MAEDKLYLLSEAAELTGATVEAIRQRIRRRTLHAIKGNDGRVRIRLTEADIAALKAARPSGQPSERPSGHPDGDSNTIKALQDHLNAAREDLTRERADRAEERQLLRHEIQNLKTDLATERAHTRDFASRLDQAYRDRQADIETRTRLEMDLVSCPRSLVPTGMAGIRHSQVIVRNLISRAGH